MFLFSRKRVCAVLLTVALLACLSAPVSDALLTQVGAGETFTVTEVVDAETVATVQFHIAPDENPLNVRVEDESGTVLHSWQNKREGVYSIEASSKPRGLVLVLDNTGSRFSSVRANFYIRRTSEMASSNKKSGIDPIETKVRSVSASLSSLQSLQVTLRNQQKDHRATVEDANERVLLWSVLQVVALVGMSAFQMYFLKRFLERRTVL